MGEKRRITSMSEKLPSINQNGGFHGFGDRLAIEDVDLQFDDDKKGGEVVRLPEINSSGSITAGQTPSNVGSRKGTREPTFLTMVDEDEELSDTDNTEVGQISKLPGDDKFCGHCAEKAAMETGKLTSRIIELQLEADRQKVQFETMKRRLDNTSKELKTAQAMIETLKDQNTEKANRIANLTREATIGLWNREKKKLLQFADVREASLQYELQTLKDSSTSFKDRALDRIQFLHDQVYKLKLRLNLSNSNVAVTKALESSEKKLASTKEELDALKDSFFNFRRNIVGMLAGIHKDFRVLQTQVDTQTYEANADFFDYAEQHESLLSDLHKAALEDNLNEKYDSLPAHFTLSDSHAESMNLRQRQKREAEQEKEEATEGRSASELEMLKELERIECALEQSSKELKDFEDINDSGISLNDYDNTSRGADSARLSSTPGGEKSVRFEDTAAGQKDDIKNKWRKRRNGTPPQTKEKSVQTDFEPLGATSGTPSRKGKRSKKSKSRSVTPNGSLRKKAPKKVEAAVRLREEQELQKKWFEAQSKGGFLSSPKSKKKGKDSRSHQNDSLNFTHIREMYGAKRIGSLIDKTTGAVDIETATQTFPNLLRASIIEGFTQFVQYDSNNDYLLDMKEVIRAISRATDQVIEPEEVKSALFELGVLETDELDFFDFLCIQETLTTGTFDRSKSQMLRLQGLEASKKSTVSKYCAVM